MTDHGGDPDPTIDPPEDASTGAAAPGFDAAAGDMVGPFKIIGTLGEGGFGVVYLAEQTEPVKRRVALKVIKAGMDTRSVIARFEAERQALAMMDFPGIARVFEAGATPEGRPYFAMEYVKGEPINRYCDRHTLDTRARLKLFAKVCDAIQHAHQKGVIHRDLKPGNILVTIDARDEPQPKVIDFGIAKATAQPLTEKTLFTEQGQLIGTPEYMSPEQAEMSAVDVDTRSDVYALGVILYELLSGKLPFDPKTLRKAGYAEIQRIIREEDPPKPSTKLTTVASDESVRIADLRKTKLAELQSTLRKELEWIPLKALRKERTERYGSAEDLAEDVRRYLDGEPLEAGPESASYRFRKLVRRNKGPFIAVALIAIALVGGIIGTTIFAVRAAENARLAEAEADRANAVKDFVTTMLSSVDPATARTMDTALMKLVLSNASDSVQSRFEEQPLVEADVRSVIGTTYRSLGQYDEVERHLRESHEIRRRLLGDEHPITILTVVDLAVLHYLQTRYKEAEQELEGALVILRRDLGDDHADTLRVMNDLGVVSQDMGKYEEADRYFQEALAHQRRVLPADHPDTLGSLYSLGRLHYGQGDYEKCLPYFVEVMELRRTQLGNDHPDTLRAINAVGWVHGSLGDHVLCERFFREALEGQERVLGPDHPETITSLGSVGALLLEQDSYEEAAPYFTEVLERSRRVLGRDHVRSIEAEHNVGVMEFERGRYAEAEPYLVQSIASFRRVLGDDHPSIPLAMEMMPRLYDAWGKPEKAAEYRALLEELSPRDETPE